MPELPEVETIRIQLERQVVGKTISDINSLHPKSLKGNKLLVINKKIKSVQRFGKLLVLDLEKNIHLAIHLKMSGQLILNQKSNIPSASLRAGKNQTYKSKIKNSESVKDQKDIKQQLRIIPKHIRVVIEFTDSSQLWFVDQRIFGWVRIMTNEEMNNFEFIKKLGKEPWDLTDQEFYKLIYKRQKAIKLAIMDQKIISGVGNIYACDSLWEAKIDPRKSAKTIRFKDVKILRAAIVKVLKEGIKYKGSTGGDRKYVQLNGLGGNYQDHFRVYDREGERCLRNDGGIIKKIKLGGRGTYLCPRCQK